MMNNKPALLDLNVLVALAWPSHIHHRIAHEWFVKKRSDGWATCPITQSGLLRLSSNARIFPDAVSPMVALELLNNITVLPDHQFWPDTLSLSDASIFKQAFLLGHRQITDAYLFSLAIHNNGLFITFDRGIKELNKVAARSHLLILEN